MIKKTKLVEDTTPLINKRHQSQIMNASEEVMDYMKSMGAKISIMETKPDGTMVEHKVKYKRKDYGFDEEEKEK